MRGRQAAGRGRRAQQIAVSLFLEECAPVDLTPVQFAALVTVRDNPGIDATRLSALVAFDRSTLGNVLERMEAKELILRSGSKDDKRVKVLHLSPKGERVLQEAGGPQLMVQEVNKPAPKAAPKPPPAEDEAIPTS